MRPDEIAVGAWMIVLTNPRKERLVLSQLKPHEFEVYRPMVAYVATPDDAPDPSEAPKVMYPNYLFVCRLSSHSPDVRRLWGVKDAWVRAEIGRAVALHRRREVNGVIAVVDKAKAKPLPVAEGDRLTTADGLIDMVVTEVLTENRVVALSTFLNRQAKVTVDLANVVRH
jgi:hypothetical protein